jgi:hypothetical protein
MRAALINWFLRMPKESAAGFHKPLKNEADFRHFAAKFGTNAATSDFPL